MSMLTHIDLIVLAQIGSVIFGTILAAPLLSSLDAKRRRAGFLCMMIGSFASLSVTAAAGLWILALANMFWAISSFRGFWILHSALRNESAQNGFLATLETPAQAASALQELLDQPAIALPEVVALAEAVAQTIVPQHSDMHGDIAAQHGDVVH